jgi:3-hydroxybutyryl-CoA dehydrogenase
VHCAAGETIYPDLCNDPAPSPSLSGKVKAGKIGMKVKEGFYTWTDESIAREKARYEAALDGAMAIIKAEGRGR